MLNEKDEENANVPFIVKPLPTSVTELQDLLKKYISRQKKDGETTESATKLKILLKRIVDYYDPLANDAEPA